MASLYLGVDGGQSSTTALIANEAGRIVGVGRGGPCNHVSGEEGRKKFFAAVGACIADAARMAGLDPQAVSFSSACLGFSGGAEDKQAYSRELIRSACYKITHDAEIALSGATAGEPGIIIIAGTGSMAFARNSDARTARAGGWGYLFGDEGGAFRIASEALRAALRHEEGWGPPTALHAVLLNTSGEPDANTFLHRLYASFDRRYIASLASLVTEAAEAGDSVAATILQNAAADLVTYVDGVYRNLFPQRSKVEVSYIGGVFRSKPLLAAFTRELQARTGCDARPPRYSPAAGALLEALRLDGNQSRLSAVPESEK
jgi:N-acetylglucosamine kinase-like BadF-type ATPase